MQIKIPLKKELDNTYNINIDTISKIHFKKKVAIVTNPKVAGFHLGELLSKVSADELYIITVSDGEEYKNQDSIDFILESLFKYRFNRSSMLIAFGGGVVGDMTGYTASMFHRGIDFIQIPTTLLSQVDSSVGGKTGINNKFGKNLIGAFHQPKEVFIDTFFLQTLPANEFSAGMAEIIKIAVAFDFDFFDFLKDADLSKDTNLKHIVAESIKIKSRVVAEDEKERGIRAALNYGHTFAHVIEKETNYIGLLHGEAVSIGMVMANELSVKLGLMSKQNAEDIKKILKKYKLPIDYKIDNIESFYKAFFLDKKSSDNSITFILPTKIGDVKITDNVTKDDVLCVLENFSSKIIRN